MGLGAVKPAVILSKMLMIMPVVFILTALLEVWCLRKKIMQFLGKRQNKGIPLIRDRQRVGRSNLRRFSHVRYVVPQGCFCAQSGDHTKFVGGHQNSNVNQRSDIPWAKIHAYALGSDHYCRNYFLLDRRQNNPT